MSWCVFQAKIRETNKHTNKQNTVLKDTVPGLQFPVPNMKTSSFKSRVFYPTRSNNNNNKIKNCVGLEYKHARCCILKFPSSFFLFFFSLEMSVIFGRMGTLNLLASVESTVRGTSKHRECSFVLHFTSLV